ncbi:MAG: D-hexose-6-phosphate mutarotase [Propionibacteriaceae bacterium]|nr:D-hexose-6-phosphate mutarotase [Propionibacteriaceae bacterium]
MFERHIDPEGWGRCQGTTPNGSRFTVHDHGAQVTEWVPAGADPVLWTSTRARYAEWTAIRGGIPICFPWFAAGRKDNKSPAHGFARLARWQLVNGQDTGSTITLHWRLDQTMIPAIEGVDPTRNRFQLDCTQVFGDDLTLTFRVRNTDSVPLVIEEALHTYFHVGDITGVQVHGLAGTEYLDKLTGAFDTHIGPVVFEGPVDRVHWTSETIEIHDPTLGRRIIITTEHAHNTVVWTPWEEGAAELSDIADGEWREFVCVETANVRNKAVHLNPGQAHELRLTLAVADL